MVMQRPLSAAVLAASLLIIIPNFVLAGTQEDLERARTLLTREDGRAEIAAPGGPACPPPELRALLVTHLRHGELEQVATLRTRRSGVRVGSIAHPVADVTVDAVEQHAATPGAA